MTDVEADGVISELGSSSDVRASVRLSRRVNGVIVYINGEERRSLGLSLGSSSDLKCQILAPGLGLALVGECAIQFQDYSEARVISMMTVEFQATVLR
ncbi:60 Kda Lysophospholipase [Manis pentadactyla]|nr:60 Kda Lysophospholipase [Manis pentadactyla]